MRNHFLRAAAGNVEPSSPYTFNHSDLTLGINTTFNFSGCSLGTPAADRIIVVGVASGHGSFGGSISGVSVGSTSLSVTANRYGYYSNTCIAYGAISSGTSSDITVNTSVSRGLTSIFVYSVYGASGLQSSNSATSTGSASLSLATSVGSRVISVVCNLNNNTTFTWSGGSVQDASEYGVLGTNNYMSSASASMIATGTTTSVTAGPVARPLSSASFF